MSDYLFSSLPQPEGTLSKSIDAIYRNNLPEVTEFHGEWGCLAVSQSHYSGFQPYETEEHLLIVIGGPVLYFRDNDFLVDGDSATATCAIYKRWVIEDVMNWDEDFSGPFTLFLVNKREKYLNVVTDLMAFIPVYECRKADGFYIGTHVDALSRICEESGRFDQVSLADFVLNDVVTYPYTAYQNISQATPASLIEYFHSGQRKEETYWQPREENFYCNLKEAAQALRKGLIGYIERVTEEMNHVAQFISAGEDSRAISGILTQRLKCDAFIFLDHMNREGGIAEKVANVYGASFNFGFRSKTHYLDILPEAIPLVGSGHQYIHAHSLGFDRKFNLAGYSAVFGGYLSDSLLKSVYAREFRNQGLHFLLPNSFLRGKNKGKDPETPVKRGEFKTSILDQLTDRRRSRFRDLKRLRPKTAHEWFVLWPATMRCTISNFYFTRRLFKSYEPFMCKEVVKISASVPVSWKLNRRLFNKAMKPFLKSSRWLVHANGRLPYFSWWVNIPVKLCVRFYRKVKVLLGMVKGNQRPWGDWQQVFKDKKWRNAVNECLKEGSEPYFIKEEIDVRQLLLSDIMTKTQKVNLLQVLYSVYKIVSIEPPFALIEFKGPKDM